jgi:thiamine biosynthesis lipoprotein
VSAVLLEPARVELAVWGSRAELLVTNPGALDSATAELRAELAEIDRACSRFREDSEIAELHRLAGRACAVGEVLGAALDAALRAAELTEGLVDPTVGDAVRDLGYDRDFAELAARPEHSMANRPRPAPGWWRLHWDPARRQVLLPRGIRIDLGATAKALAADRAARRAARAAGCGVLVSLGGDVAVAGEAPEGGWRVALADDHRHACARPDQTIALVDGGLATSSTVARAWRGGGRVRHHIVDPRSGDNPEPVWRTATVAARTCVDANTASTAAIVLGARAPDWLDRLGMPSRLVAVDGRVDRVAGWPADEEGA